MAQLDGDDQLLAIPRCGLLQSPRSLKLLSLYKLEAMTQSAPIHADLISEAELTSAIECDNQPLQQRETGRMLLYGDSLARRMECDLPASAFDVVGKGGFDAPKLRAFIPRLPKRHYQKIGVIDGCNDNRRQSFDSHQFMCAYESLVRDIMAQHPETAPEDFYLFTIPPAKIRNAEDELMRAVSNTIICCTARHFGAVAMNLDEFFDDVTSETLNSKLIDAVHFRPAFQKLVAKAVIDTFDGARLPPAPFSVKRKLPLSNRRFKKPTQSAYHGLKTMPNCKPNCTSHLSALKKPTVARQPDPPTRAGATVMNTRNQPAAPPTLGAFLRPPLARQFQPLVDSDTGGWTEVRSDRRNKRRHQPSESVPALMDLHVSPVVSAFWSAQSRAYRTHFPLIAASV